MTRLQDLMSEAARRFGERPAVVGADGAATYGELDRLADRVAGALARLGVRTGDRVALWAEKSVRGVATLQGALRLGAAYVPIDPRSPTPRAALILQDADVRAIVTTSERAAQIRALGATTPLLRLDGGVGDDAWDQAVLQQPERRLAAQRAGTELAYILFTSGSTGVPKGVCLSHRNALSFVEWAVDALRIRETDRLANHAPFHFDLSVLDLYGAFAAGASVHLIPELTAYAARALGGLLRDQAITILYAVPSALMLLMSEADLLARRDLSLRTVVFAGEPFPIQHLRALRAARPDWELWNFYGPTETNVCTAHRVDTIPDGSDWVPIGAACSGDEAWAVREDGQLAQTGEEGELMVTGPTVMLGYWGRAPQGGRPYATGDVVQVLVDGAFRYVGRRDAMLKIRGYRVEPGEVEAVLRDHPAIDQAGVTDVGTGPDTRLVAAVVLRPGAGEPSLLDVKRHCAARLPPYMVIDRMRVVDQLPRTANGKLDRQQLRQTRTDRGEIR